MRRRFDVDRVHVRLDERNEPATSLRRPRPATRDARRSPALPRPSRAARLADSRPRGRRGRPSRFRCCRRPAARCAPRRHRRPRTPLRLRDSSSPETRTINVLPCERPSSSVHRRHSPRSPRGRSHHSPYDSSVSSSAVWGAILSHPFTPYGARMRPMTTTGCVLSSPTRALPPASRRRCASRDRRRCRRAAHRAPANS